MKKIVAVVNSENQTHPSIDLARHLLSSEGGTIDIVTTMPHVPPILGALWSGQDIALERELLIEKQTKLNNIASSIQIDHVTINAYVLQGKPFLEITRLAITRGADIVVSDDSIDLDDFGVSNQGATNFQLFRRCPKPVWLSNTSRSLIPRKIVAAIDVEDSHSENIQLNEKILSTAVDLSERFEVPMEVVHAWELFGESIIVRKYGLDVVDRERDAYMEKIRAVADSQLKILSERNASYEFHLLNGPPGDAITAFAQRNDIDLIVMGTVGRSGISGVVMGNTAEKVLQKAKSSIIALKPDGFHAPDI